MTRPRQASSSTKPPHGRRRALRGWGIARELLRDAGILPSREAPRHWHWLAAIAAMIYQCVWCLALIWLVYAQFLLVMPLYPEGDGTGHNRAIEVTLIDRPSPAQAWPTPLPEPLDPLPEPLPEPLPAPIAETSPVPPPESAPEPVPAPPTPLMVTEVNEPDGAFTLHVPEFQQPVPPSLAPTPPPEAQRELPIAEIALLPPPETRLPPVTPPIPTLSADVAPPELALPERDIPAPLPELELRPLPAPDLPPVEMLAHTPVIKPREIALTPLEPPPPGIEPAAPAPPDITSPVAEIDLTPPSEIIPSSPPLDDAWDLPDPSEAETGSGLLDAQGRPRLAGANGRPGGGLPPGTLIEDYANIDRMGSWRKRAITGGVDYQPGPLEPLWVPHENILEEWVRRSIKNIMIPIPGTNKVIRCTVVLLMLGGGCGITDPNLLDLEATSRPPPDIPFKPELHEDQDSLGTPNPARDPPETP